MKMSMEGLEGTELDLSGGHGLRMQGSGFGGFGGGVVGEDVKGALKRKDLSWELKMQGKVEKDGLEREFEKMKKWELEESEKERERIEKKKAEERKEEERRGRGWS